MAPRPGVGGASHSQHMVGPALLKGPASPGSPDLSGAAAAPRPPAGTGQAWPWRSRRRWARWRAGTCTACTATPARCWRRPPRASGSGVTGGCAATAAPGPGPCTRRPRWRWRPCTPGCAGTAACPAAACSTPSCSTPGAWRPAPPCTRWAPAPGTRAGAKGCWSSARPASWGGSCSRSCWWSPRCACAWLRGAPSPLRRLNPSSSSRTTEGGRLRPPAMPQGPPGPSRDVQCLGR